MNPGRTAPRPVPKKSISPAVSIPTCAFRSAKSPSVRPTPSTANWKPTNRCAFMIAAARGETNPFTATSNTACPRCAATGFCAAAMSKKSPVAPRRCSAPNPAASSPNCATPARASSRRKWNSSPSAKTWGANTPRPKTAAKIRSTFQHPGQSFGAAIPARNHARIRPRRSGPRPGHHPLQHQPSRIGADDHRPQFPGQNQRQHRQLRRRLHHRGGSREDALGHPLGRRHGHGPFHRQEHPRHPRMDPAQLARAHRHGAHLPGAGKSRRQGRGTDLGDLSRHAHRAMRAGRGLLHHPRRRPAAFHPADRAARHRHRQPRRLHPGQMVPGPSPGKFLLHPLGRNLRDHGRLRRELFHRRRPAPRLHCRRQRRGAIRRTGSPGRPDQARLGRTASRS